MSGRRSLLDRRRFLGLLVAGVGGVGLGALTARLTSRPADLEDVPWADWVVEGLRKQLDYLRIEDGELERFAADYRRRFEERIVLATADAGYSVATHVLPGSARRMLRGTAFEESQLEQTGLDFLASSTFFYTGADESQPVRYRRLDAIWGACSNPFARFDFPAG